MVQASFLSEIQTPQRSVLGQVQFQNVWFSDNYCSLIEWFIFQTMLASKNVEDKKDNRTQVYVLNIQSSMHKKIVCVNTQLLRFKQNTDQSLAEIVSSATLQCVR